MSRRKKMLRNLAIAVAALVVIAVAAFFIVTPTAWFRDYVKQKIIASTENSTGGKVDLGFFSFDPRHLRAVITNFVIHGSESSTAAPFLRVPRLEVDIRLFTSVHHLLDVSYLEVDHPEANIVVLPNGRTNVPSPKATSNKTATETMVDAAIGHFELTNGVVTVASQKQPLNVRGSNLRVQFWYNPLNQGYHGQLSFDPLYVVSGRNTPVNFTITLPVSLQRDRIDFQQARITTPQSSILINGSIENLREPKISAHVNGHIALADLKNTANLQQLDTDSRRLPSALDLDANAIVAANTIQVTGLRLGLGQSDLEASGALKSPNGGALEFKGRLSLSELSRLMRVAAQPNGTVLLNGTAKLDAANHYQVNGNIQASNLSFQESGRRISGVNLYSTFDLVPGKLDLNGLRVTAFGGDLAGDVSVENFSRYRLNARLQNLSLQTVANAMGQRRFPYDGAVSGPVEAAGDLKTPGLNSVNGAAKLSIAPGNRGVPVSGIVNASYNGAADDIRVENSYIALPHSRLALNGSVGKQVNFALTSSNLNDLLAVAPAGAMPPLALNGGQASFNGTLMGRLTSPRIMGHLAMNRFAVEGRQFDQLSADTVVSSTGAAIRNASLTRGGMQLQASMSVGLRDWKALPNEPLSANASIQNGDLADLLALAGQPNADYSGMLAANLNAGGTVGNPRGAAALSVTSGTLHGEPFDRIQAQVNLSNRLVTVSNAYIQAPAARIDLTARFEHPRDSFTTGCLQAHVNSGPVDLAQLRSLQKERSGAIGLVQWNGDVSGMLSKAKKGGQLETEFLLTSVNADASVRGLRLDGQNYGDLTASARTSNQTVRYNLTSDFAGSNVRVNGATHLAREYPTTADASISNLPVERVLALAHRTDIRAKGNLSGAAHLAGTMTNPQGNADFDLANAVLYDEPLEHVRARLAYQETSIDLPELQIVAGPSHIDLTARYDHAARNLEAGNLQFHLNDSRIDLARIKNLQERWPGLGGALQLAANGAAEVRPAQPRLLIRDLDGNLKASGLSEQGKNLGDLTLTANTSAGKLNFALNSTLAGASIQGRGAAQLIASYPVDAQLSFSNVTWAHISPLIGSSTGVPPAFDAAADGQLRLRGPAMNEAELTGSLQLTRLQATRISTTARAANHVFLQNQGPISVALDRGVVRIEQAHLSGPQTDFQASGTVPLRGSAMNVNLTGNANLAMLENFSQDITSSGSIAIMTAVRGTIASPLVNGRLELHNGSINYATLPNGLANANGVVLFNGRNAVMRDVTAESGGGKVTLNGFLATDGTIRFGLRANTSNVRVLVQEGVNVVTDSQVNLNGTPQTSVLSGTVTINRVTYAPQTDLGSVLTRAAPPVQAAAPPSPLLENMKLDIHVRSSNALAVQAAMAENLEANADLRIRGTAIHPGVLGRITITEGQLVFFGTDYKVNTGTIAFYNPVRIEPVLDLSLETQAKGVDVVVKVTGPVDNMKLTYTSDPPLQFQEIIGLLAAGRTPTSDPTLLANQPSAPPQSYQQMGESALVSKALADPMANRLQRVFGVSQLKIAPTFTSGSQLPQAQLTLQQRVADNITFTYVTALNAANAQTIEVEVALNPQWSATATRDYNGIFSINLLYKKHLH